MSPYEAKNAYQEANVRSANPIRLVLMVYDRMLTDMQKALESLETGDIEARTNSIRHSMECLDHLQANLNMQNGGEAAKFLWQFYTHMRGKLLEAQIKQSANVLKEQMWLLQQVRGEWEKAERHLFGAKPEETPAVSAPVFAGEQVEKTSAWTA